MIGSVSNPVNEYDENIRSCSYFQLSQSLWKLH